MVMSLAKPLAKTMDWPFSPTACDASRPLTLRRLVGDDEPTDACLEIRGGVAVQQVPYGFECKEMNSIPFIGSLFLDIYYVCYWIRHYNIFFLIFVGTY